MNTIHRFSHEDCPYPCLYLAVDLDTGLFERFGDEAYDRQNTVPQSLWAAHCVTSIQVPALQVCDLTNARTLSALRADLSALMHHDLAAPQEWGLAIQRHPANFQGVKFKSRFNGRACLALFRRDAVEERLRQGKPAGLSSNEAAVGWLDKHRVSLY